VRGHDVFSGFFFRYLKFYVGKMNKNKKHVWKNRKKTKKVKPQKKNRAQSLLVFWLYFSCFFDFSRLFFRVCSCHQHKFSNKKITRNDMSRHLCGPLYSDGASCCTLKKNCFPYTLKTMFSLFFLLYYFFTESVFSKA